MKNQCCEKCKGTKIIVVDKKKDWIKEFDNLLEEKLFPYPCQECGLGQDEEATKLIKSFISNLLETQRKELLKEYKPARICKLSQSGNILQALIEVPSEDCEIFIKTKLQ